MAGHELEVVWRLGLSVLLAACIGLERELHRKSAGVRTLTLVSLGAALFVLVSKYGFLDGAVRTGRLDTSRVAAQIVSGIGFIGGGLIFVRRDAVQGLTTAGAVWVTAAIGMACGAALAVLAAAATACYLLVVAGWPVVARRLPHAGRCSCAVQLTYRDGHGVLRHALAQCTHRGFAIANVAVQSAAPPGSNGSQPVTVLLEMLGSRPVSELAADLTSIDGILHVTAGDGVARE